MPRRHAGIVRCHHREAVIEQGAVGIHGPFVLRGVMQNRSATVVHVRGHRRQGRLQWGSHLFARRPDRREMLCQRGIHAATALAMEIFTVIGPRHKGPWARTGRRHRRQQAIHRPEYPRRTLPLARRQGHLALKIRQCLHPAMQGSGVLKMPVVGSDGAQAGGDLACGRLVSLGMTHKGIHRCLVTPHGLLMQGGPGGRVMGIGSRREHAQPFLALLRPPEHVRRRHGDQIRDRS